MKFFNLDMHISVIEDIKHIFHDLGHQVDSVCMSGHSWVFGRERESLPPITHENWYKARLTEGASQRVQEDTLKFARIMEGLGAELLRSLMTLVAFTPILWGLSKSITVLPWIGPVDHALVWVAIVSASSDVVSISVALSVESS